MTPDQIRQQFPEAYAAIMAAGVLQERTRVATLLDFAAGGVDHKLAHTAIREGAEMTPTLMGQFLEQRYRRVAIDDRQAETDAAGRDVDGARAHDRRNFGADAVAAELDKLMGGEIR